MLEEERRAEGTRRTEETRTDGARSAEMMRMLEENRGMATGTIIASALAAAVIAYMLRRAREEEQQKPVARAGRAFERARELVGDNRLEAGREFMMERVLPEFKPVMLAILKDFEQVTDQWFRQAEKAVKRM